jgi:IS5 family transposase
MRSNKIHNVDLFTQAANDHFSKHVKTQSKQALEIINKKIDWRQLVKPLERAFAKIKTGDSPAGRKPMELVLIVKCFLLQHLYALSDPRLEEEIADRRSFQMFLGLNSADAIPDETTICRYRALFAQHGLDKTLFQAFHQQMASLGLLVGKGTIIDASLKQAQATPQSKRDTDARFTSRKGRPFHGYKAHIGLDADTNIIHSVEFTAANVHDTRVFDQLLTGQERAVYADKGYANKERRATLKASRVRDGILHKAYRNRPLTKHQRARNKLLSAIRNSVERPFGFMKQVLNYQRCRYFDLARNRFQFVVAAVLYNLRRMLSLTATIRA